MSNPPNLVNNEADKTACKIAEKMENENNNGSQRLCKNNDVQLICQF